MTPNPDTILAAADVLRQIIGPLVERLAAAEARLALLEQQPIGVLDAGTWAFGEVYQQGDGVTHHGHYWIAQAETHDQPTEGASAWRLAVRRGKQGSGGQCRCPERERVAS